VKQTAVFEKLGVGLAAVRCSRRWSRPESEENGSGWGYKGLELVLGGANGCYDLGEAAGVVGCLGREASEVDFAGAASSSALSEKRKRGSQRGVGHGEKWMRTPGARPLHCDRKQASSCVARCIAAHVKAAPAHSAAALDRARDPHRITIAIHIQFFLFFCKILPKFELKSNFHQNKSCSEF